MKGREKKKQHFVPKAYLAAWIDPDCPPGQAYVWIFDKETGVPRRKGPENLFTVTDLYTIKMPDGGRNLTIEDGLQHIEQGIKALRIDYLEQRKPIPLVRHIKLMAFVSAMQARTLSFRDHHRSTWEKILKVGEDLEAKVADMQPSERKKLARMTLPSNGPTMGMAEARALADNPIQHILPGILETEIPILAEMQLTVYFAPPGSSFITSDAPATRFDSQANRRPLLLRGPGLAFKTIEIVLPISPRMALLIHHTQPPVRGIKPVAYRDVPKFVVDEINRRTFAYAKGTVVANHNVFNEDWRLPKEGGNDRI